MQECLIIQKINGGYKIKDSINNYPRKYYGYTLREAVKQHRIIFDLRYKHLEQIHI